MTEQVRQWSTAEARPGEALAYWIDAICEAFLEMKADSPDRPHFAASIAQYPLGPIDLNFANTTSQEVWRTPHAIAGSRKHTFYLLFIREGHLVARQRGREAVVAPGDCTLIDGMEPYSFSFPETNRCLSVQMPAEWLRNWMPAPDKITAASFANNPGWGRTLASAAANLASCDLDALALPHAAIADQLGALLALASGREVAAPSRRDELLARIRATMRERLHDAALDPSSVAERHGISLRYLHLLFAESGSSFGATLIEQRLEQAKRLLADRRFAALPVSEIAWRCGFREPSHFARRFRTRYGAAPAAYRRTLHS